MVTAITGLASGYFATLMHLPPGPPIALTTDGVGTKIMLAEEANHWEPIGVDCVANNVNDLICVGAVPLALLDYIATDRIDEAVLDEVARGLFLHLRGQAGRDRHPGGRDRADRRDARQVGQRRPDARPGGHRDRRAPAGRGHRRRLPAGAGRQRGRPGRRRHRAAELGAAQQRVLAGPARPVQEGRPDARRPGARLRPQAGGCAAPADPGVRERGRVAVGGGASRRTAWLHISGGGLLNITPARGRRLLPA